MITYAVKEPMNPRVMIQVIVTMIVKVSSGDEYQLEISIQTNR